MAAAGGPSSGGGKISDDKVVIGVLNDQSGVYKRPVRPELVKVAVQMAIDDYKAKYGDKAVAKDIEVVSADHQNKPDVANTKAQEMYDREQGRHHPRRADLVGRARRRRRRPRRRRSCSSTSAPATTALTGKQCNKYTFH